jgi:hypothetical protein
MHFESGVCKMTWINFDDIENEIETGASVWESTGPSMAEWRQAGIVLRVGNDPMSSHVYVVTPQREIKSVGYLNNLTGKLAINLQAHEFRALDYPKPLQEIISAAGWKFDTEAITSFELATTTSMVPLVETSYEPLQDPDSMPTLIFTGRCISCGHTDHGLSCGKCALGGPCG